MNLDMSTKEIIELLTQNNLYSVSSFICVTMNVLCQQQQRLVPVKKDS